MAVREREDEGANGCVRVPLKNGVGASADDLGVALTLKLLNQLREEPLKANLVRGQIGADRVEPVVDELLDAVLDVVANGPYLVGGFPCGSSTSQSSTMPGT